MRIHDLKSLSASNLAREEGDIGRLKDCEDLLIQSNLMQLHKSLGGSAASTALARWDEYLKSPTAPY